jgi:aldose 1-epimerase
LIELRSGAVRLALAPKVGGAVAAFEHDGVSLFRSTSAGAIANGDVRGFSSYPLVPFSNRIAGATLHWDGTTYSLARYLPGDGNAIHGNGWQREWTIVATEPTRATIELVHDAIGERAFEWPFPYRALQEFVLTPDSLSMRLAITNTRAESSPCGLGWHPFFPRSASTELAFIAKGVWETDAAKLPTRLSPVAAQYDFRTPRRLRDVALDHCFAGWRPPAIARWPETDVALAIDADPPCEYLVVYVPSGTDYFAVEPVSHMTDAFNRANTGGRDTGTRILAPGETFSCTMHVSVRLPA